jgi:hypothetical protein
MGMAGTPPQGYAQQFFRAYRLPLRLPANHVFANCIARGRALCHTDRRSKSTTLRQITGATPGPKHVVAGEFVNLQAPAPLHLRTSRMTL